MIGLRRGQASACLYSEEAKGVCASVHGDDVTVRASREDAEWLIQKLKKRCEIKTQMIGETADLDKQLQILNWTVRWSTRGLWIEAEPRHVKEVIKALGLEGASPAPNRFLTLVFLVSRILFLSSLPMMPCPVTLSIPEERSIGVETD